MMLALALLLALPSSVWAARQCAGPGIIYRPEICSTSDMRSIITYNTYLLPVSVRDIPFIGDKFAVAQEERAALKGRSLADMVLKRKQQQQQ